MKEIVYYFKSSTCLVIENQSDNPSVVWMCNITEVDEYMKHVDISRQEVLSYLFNIYIY